MKREREMNEDFRVLNENDFKNKKVCERERERERRTLKCIVFFFASSKVDTQIKIF